MEKINFAKSSSAVTTNVESIVVHSKSINVELLRNTSDAVEVRFYGEVVTNGSPRMELEVEDGVCNIRAEISGGSWMGEARLDIMLPKKVFSQLEVESDFADITVSETPKAEQLHLHTKNYSIIFQ